MNLLIQLKTTQPLLIILTLLCFSLLPKVQAVVPPPPGGYPNFTTAAGDHALQALTSGIGNTAIGTSSLFSVTTGSFNTAVGAGSLDLNTADNNTAMGTAALLLNTTGTENTATGTAALEFNSTGNYNTANGAFALSSNTNGTQHTAVGYLALFSNAGGANNTAVGFRALASTTSSNLNTALGASALDSDTTGAGNTATGALALSSNDTGSTNTANGYDALQNNTTGDDNIAVGFRALQLNTTGSRNTAIGESAGRNQNTGSDNVYIGSGMEGLAGESNACYIKSIFGQTSASGIQILINSDNKLGTTTSSKRFKENIKPMDKASEALLALKPVIFHYKKEIDPTGKSQFGLVAEDVEKVNPDLVVCDKEGKAYSVRYDQVNAMLLNEFLKEHSTVLELKKEVAALTAGLQKVSAQLAAASPSHGGLEASKFATGRIRGGGPAPQVVSNP